MANYNGSKCIVCGKIFEEKDDIVVCPECGTPYHRDCYKQAGECINKELHDKGISWSQKNNFDGKTAEKAEQEENKVCPRCGFNNSQEQNFCSQCGLPLKSDYESQHFNDGNNQNPYSNFGPMGQDFDGQRGQFQGGQPFNPFLGGFVEIEDDTDIDGLRAKDIADYVGSNKFYFLAQFMRIARLKMKRSFNFCAFLFPEYYYFYRKMIGHGFFFMTFKIVMSVFMQSMLLNFNVSSATTTTEIMDKLSSSPLWSGMFLGLSLLSLIIYIVSGMFSNFWYFKKAKHDIDEIDQVAQSQIQRRDTIAKRGGTSFGITIVAIAAYYLIIRIIAMLIL